jgi:hypothetical protein
LIDKSIGRIVVILSIDDVICKMMYKMTEKENERTGGSYRLKYIGERVSGGSTIPEME